MIYCQDMYADEVENSLKKLKTLNKIESFVQGDEYLKR